jgi:hypothetical protein
MPVLQRQTPKKGYIPIGNNGVGFFQGTYLKDFWMWTGKTTKFEDGTEQIKTVRVKDLKEAALHYYRDKWIPVEPITDDMLRAMEVELRAHQGLKREGVDLLDTEFLELRTIPGDYIMPGVDISDKKVKDEITAETIAAYKQKLLGR